MLYTLRMQMWLDINPSFTLTSGKYNSKSDSYSDHKEDDERNDDQTTFPAFTKPVFYANLFVVDQFYSVIRNWISKIRRHPPTVNVAK